MAILDLKQGTASKVFRTIVSLLKADPTLSGAITQWMVWEGSEWDSNVMTSLQAPAIRLTPIPSSRSWYSPDSFLGDLIIQVEIGIPSVDCDDYLNLWEAMERALYPYGDRDAQNVIQQAIRDAGSQTGQVVFNMPISDPAAVSNNDGQWWCHGQMKIDIQRVINP